MISTQNCIYISPINELSVIYEFSYFIVVEQEEIKVSTSGLLYRLNSVDIAIKTPRNELQEKALENVTKVIEQLTEEVNSDRELAVQKCLSYLSACSSNERSHCSTPSDEKFQSAIIECAVDDQKKIRKKLESLYEILMQDLDGNSDRK